MRHRVFRQLSTGKFFESVLTVSEGRVEPARFSVSMQQHRQNIADAFSVLVDDVEGIEGEGGPPDFGSDTIRIVPPPPTPEHKAAKRLNEWVKDKAEPAPTRQVILDMLRVVKNLKGDD